MQNAVRHLWLGLVCSAALLAQNTPPGTRVIASTVPANGDVNPYGIAIVPESVGDLTEGSVLISNFNNSSNLQGTGTTIVQITPRGHRHWRARANRQQQRPSRTAEPEPRLALERVDGARNHLP